MGCSEKENYSAFLAASGGDPPVIVKDRDAVKKFFVEKMGFTEDDEFDMPAVVFLSKCYSIYGDPLNGVCISPNNGQGLIPDAAINSLKGYEYGRDLCGRRWVLW